MNELQRFSIIKPTIETPFHIDFAWWKQSDNNWHVFLSSLLCPEHQKLFGDFPNVQVVDSIDAETAEVQSVDGLQYIVMTHCAKQTGFLTNNTTLVDSVFRIFLANGNISLSSTELSIIIGRQADIILRTLTGGHVFKGLRPCHQVSMNKQ
jgi:hypothetical protein